MLSEKELKQLKRKNSPDRPRPSDESGLRVEISRCYNDCQKLVFEYEKLMKRCLVAEKTLNAVR